jgi:hypothetical protein
MFSVREESENDISTVEHRKGLKIKEIEYTYIVPS